MPASNSEARKRKEERDREQDAKVDAVMAGWLHIITAKGEVFDAYVQPD